MMTREILTMLIAAWCAITQPTRFRCAPQFYVEGVRPSGVTRCVERPPGNGDTECVTVGACNLDDRVPFAYPIRIYCHPSQRPLVVNETTVACSTAR